MSPLHPGGKLLQHAQPKGLASLGGDRGWVDGCAFATGDDGGELHVGDSRFDRVCWLQSEFPGEVGLRRATPGTGG